MLGTPRVSQFQQALNAPADYRVAIEVQAFVSEPGEAATLNAVWIVRRTKDGKTETGRTDVARTGLRERLRRARRRPQPRPRPHEPGHRRRRAARSSAPPDRPAAEDPAGRGAIRILPPAVLAAPSAQRRIEEYRPGQRRLGEDVALHCLARLGPENAGAKRQPRHVERVERERRNGARARRSTADKDHRSRNSCPPCPGRRRTSRCSR